MDFEGANNTGKNLGWFGIVLTKKAIGTRQTKTSMDVKNEGMPMPEVIMHIEMWLESAKEDFKKGIRENFYFDNRNP